MAGGSLTEAVFQVFLSDGTPAVSVTTFEEGFEDRLHHHGRVGHARNVERCLIDVGERVGQRVAERFEEVVVHLHVERLGRFGAQTVPDNDLPGDVTAFARGNHFAVGIENGWSAAQGAFELGEVLLDVLS